MGSICYNFAHDVVVITGAATGIGRGTAVAFAKAGANVAVCDFNEEKGRETARLCREAGAEIANFYRVDVTRAEDFSAARDAILRDFGTVDILFSNAGIAQNELGSPTALDMAEWNKLFSVNVFGMIRACQTFAPIMMEKKAGKIVLTASIAAYMPSDILPAYSSSKAACINYAQSLSLELGAYNINVNVLNPGYVYTPIYSEGGAMKIRDANAAKLGHFQTGEEVLNAIAMVNSSMHRAQTVEDMANTVLFLCSQQAKELTGQVLNVDSGVIRR